MPACDDRTSDAVKREQLLGVTMWCTGGSLAHWMTSYKFLNAVPGFDGISIDMHQPMAHSGTPSTQKNQLGSVKIETRPKNMLTSRRSPLVKTVEFGVAVRVQDVISVITINNMQHYRFHPEGCGCMHWQLTLLQAYVRNGWIRNEDFRGIYDAISTLIASKPSLTFPPVAGEFYQRQH